MAVTSQERAGKALDLLEVGLYLASHASSMVTGRTLAIDGGFLAI